MTLDLEYPEGATPISDEEKEGVLPHVTTRSELNLWEQRGIVDPEGWAFRRRPNQLLTEEFIQELHKADVRQGVLWAGAQRKRTRTSGGRGGGL